MAPWPTTQFSNFAAMQLKLTITIGKLYTYNDEYKYLLDSFLCLNLFAELNTFNTLCYVVLNAGVGRYCSPVIGL